MNELDLPQESVVPNTPVDWSRRKMAASAITTTIATRCALSLRFDGGAEGYPYIHIPYHLPCGTPTTFYRQRVYDAYLSQAISYEERKRGTRAGKYRNAPKQSNRIYWPVIEDQSAKLRDAGVDMVICEGEFKSICVQSSALGSGLPLCVAGIGGVHLNDDILKDLDRVVFKVTVGGQEIRRRVFVAMDFNGRGDSREHSHSAEQKLSAWLVERGAEVFLLRWPLEEGVGEQKIDDWLVAGGDLSEALRYSESLRTQHQSVLQKWWDYFNENYVICAGKFVPIRNHQYRFGKEPFEIEESVRYVDVDGLIGRKNTQYGAAAIWGKQPRSERNFVDGFTFAPYPMGVAPERYVHREGQRLFNVAPAWPGDPILWTDDVPYDDVAPFIWLLKRLCCGAEEWFLDFIAQIAQRPWERGHSIPIFSDDGGTGKGRLADTLKLLFGRYFVPVGNAFKNDFNGHLESALIALWSEPESHGRKDVAINAIMKNYSGDTDVMINHKFGNQYSVPNYGRLIIMTNNEYVTAYDRTDRRLVVMGGDAPLTPAEAREYMEWATAHVPLLQRFLVGRDLSKFNVFARGPLTRKWEQGIESSAPAFLQFVASHPELQRKDVWTVEELMFQYKELHSTRPGSAVGLGKMLKKAGYAVREINNKKTAFENGKQRAVKFYALRGNWENEGNDEWLEEAQYSAFPKHAG